MAILVALLYWAIANCWAGILVPWFLVAGVSILYTFGQLSFGYLTVIIIMLAAPIFVFLTLFNYLNKSLGRLRSERVAYLAVCACLWLMCQGSNLETLLMRVFRTLNANSSLATLMVLASSQILNCMLLAAFVLLVLLLVVELPLAWMRSALGQEALLPYAAIRLVMVIFLCGLGGSLLMEMITRSVVM